MDLYYDSIYYTEADQIVHIKDAEALLHFPKDIRYLVPHRMEELYEGEGADRGDGFFWDNRKFVIANGRAPASDSTYYKARDNHSKFGGAWLASRKLFLGTRFIDSWNLPVEQACFNMYQSGTCWKTVDYSGFFVEHLSGIEFHEKLYNLKQIGVDTNGTTGEGLETGEAEEGSGEAVDVQVPDLPAEVPVEVS